MKKLRYIVLLVALCIFAGCYEVNEDISIDGNGAGTYLMKMDMSQMVAMMQNMASADELAKSGFDRVVDTTVNLKDLLDTSSKVTPEEKRLYSTGTMKFQLNAKENLLKADMNFPFRSLGDLQLLMSGAGSIGLAQALQKMMGKDGGEASQMQDQGLGQISNVYDVAVTKGSIVRKINQERFKALMERPEMAQVKQMTGAGIEVPYTTTIRLPRPVKKFDGPFVTVSDDKRTVTVKSDMMKIFDAPEKFSYSIYY